MKKQFNFYMSEEVQSLLQFIQNNDVDYMYGLSFSQIVEKLIWQHYSTVDPIVKIQRKGLLDDPYCPRCDTYIPDSEKFCPNCHARLDWGDLFKPSK